MALDHNPPQGKPDYEVVFTVTDYYDGPRRGVANFQGRPHFYDCLFDTNKDEYSDLYWLTPLDEQLFLLAIEDWGIWRKWESAFHSGKACVDSHPALPDDAVRHRELAQVLDQALVTDPKRAIRRIGNFEHLGNSDLPKGVLRLLQVKWSEP